MFRFIKASSFRLLENFKVIQALEGGQVIQGIGQAGAMNVGRRAAVLRFLDVRVRHQVVFIVNDRGLAPDQDDGLAVVQHPHFVRRHQFTAHELGTGGHTAVPSPPHAGSPISQGLLAQQVRYIFVALLLY